MIVGGSVGSAPGRTSNHILSIEAKVIAGNVLMANIEPVGRYRRHYWAPYVNGIYTGSNVKCHLKEDIQVVSTIPFDSPVGSLYLEDAGRFSSFSGSRTPSNYAEYIDALTALMIQFSWSGNYELTSPVGDSQLVFSGIQGAKRGFNTELVIGNTTRGRLYYSISSDGSSNHTVRFWSYGTLVAQGTRNGDGDIVCNETNQSGLSILVTLTYTADVKAGDAFIECRYPSGYQIHYSTSALSFPRTPEAFVQDSGGIDNYVFLSGSLASGTYNYNVLQVDDAGNIQSSAYPTTSALTINASPDFVTGTTLSIVNSSGVHYIQMSFDMAGGSISHNIYSSPSENSPIDFLHPLPLAAGLNTAYIATIYPDSIGGLPQINPAVIDDSSSYTTLLSAFDTAMVSANTAYDAGETGFSTSFRAVIDSLIAAVTTYSNDLEEDLNEYKAALESYGEIVLSTAANVSGLSMTSGDWTLNVYHSYGHFLAFIGSLISGEVGRYHFTDGSVLTSDDGTVAANLPNAGETLYQAGLPFIYNSEFRACVRAIEGGIEEQSNNEITISLLPDGSISLDTPNTPQIVSETLTGLGIAVQASVDETDSKVDSDTLYIWLDAIGIPLDIDNISSSQVNSVALPDTIANYHAGILLFNISTSGWYHYAVRSSGAGKLSNATEIKNIYFAPLTTGQAVSNLSAKVIRGKA